MTVCISALCKENNEDLIVFAADKMVSMDLGGFEHDIMKYQVLNENTVALFAGDVKLKDCLLKGDFGSMAYNDIQKKIKSNIDLKRRDIIQNEILNTFGIDFDAVGDLLRNSDSSSFSAAILSSIMEKDLNASILLLGFEDNHAKMCEIQDVGVNSYDSFNFHAIGSRAWQSYNTLLLQKQSSSNGLDSTLYNVYKAKKSSKVTEGVGMDTDMGIISKDGVFLLDDKYLNTLGEIYNNELDFGKYNPKLEALKSNYCNEFRGVNHV